MAAPSGHMFDALLPLQTLGDVVDIIRIVEMFPAVPLARRWEIIQVYFQSVREMSLSAEACQRLEVFLSNYVHYLQLCFVTANGILGVV